MKMKTEFTSIQITINVMIKLKPNFYNQYTSQGVSI